MSAKDPHANPVLEAQINDLFDKDPEALSEIDLDKIVKYYRDLRVTWSTKEEEKVVKKDAKAKDKIAKIKEMTL